MKEKGKIKTNNKIPSVFFIKITISFLGHKKRSIITDMVIMIRMCHGCHYVGEWHAPYIVSVIFHANLSFLSCNPYTVYGLNEFALQNDIHDHNGKNEYEAGNAAYAAVSGVTAPYSL